MVLLEAKNVVKKFPIKGGFFGRTVGHVHALNDVSLSIAEGETVGLVGESGCGKTTLGRLIMRLMAPTSGQIIFEGQDLTRWSEGKLRPLRKKFQMIFQDPYSSLNPRMTVGQILTEPLTVHKINGGKPRRERVFEMLQKVGLAPEAYEKYPHEFSGGQRQRVGIARALMLAPRLVVADEPVSALDVSIQAQIINLLETLQKELNLTYLFIAHDLKVVRHISKKIVVMYLGHIVEEIPSENLAQARHPYTHALLSAVPVPNPELQREKIVLKGDVPSPIDPPSGCVFRTRCPYAQAICAEQVPLLEEITAQHHAACHFWREIHSFEKLTINNFQPISEKIPQPWRSASDTGGSE
ncbi:MAG TPA: peptide ABC transporter ATP-binding protein [Deltaproteobacteria bacterium]|nr:peptide ABC transporter ATP-binding protein [Deltaproteobacteria bacterium]